MDQWREVLSAKLNGPSSICDGRRDLPLLSCDHHARVCPHIYKINKCNKYIVISFYGFII